MAPTQVGAISVLSVSSTTALATFTTYLTTGTSTMAMSITVKIDLDESGTYTPAEAAVIAALANDVAANPAPAAAAPAEKIPAGVAADARIAEAKAAAAAKAEADAAKAAKAQAAAEAKAATEAAAAEPAAPSEEATLQAMEADLVGGDAPTLQDAVTLATNMVGAGKAAQVKAALAAAGGAKRVSELKGDAIATFMTAAQG